jgi:ABC-2 type transport system permease protein
MNALRARQLKALFKAELTLLSRNSVVVGTSVAVPIAIAIFVVVRSDDGGVTGAGWSLPVSMLLLLMFGMSVYMTTTLALTARREDLYLKRLRSGEASDMVVLIGVLSPVILIGVLQCLLVVGVVALAGSTTPANPWLLLLAIILGITLAVTAGIATTGLVGSTQQADMASVPFFVVLLATGYWAGTSGAAGPSLAQSLSPGGAVFDVVRHAYDRGAGPLDGFTHAVRGLGVLAAWALFAMVTVRRFFRWEPRH